MVTTSPTPTRVLLAASTPLTRALMECDLLAAGYEVVLAGTLDRALQSIPHQVEAVVCELALAGGGAFTLAGEVRRRFPAVPVVVVSPRAEDDATRALAHKNEVAAVLCPPHLRTALVSAIERGRLLRAVESGAQITVSVDHWSIADAIRAAVSSERPLVLEIPGPDLATTLYTRDGNLWAATRGDDTGEGVFRDVLGVRTGDFTVRPALTTDIPRSIHRPLDRLLLEGLGLAIVWQRQLADLPGLLLPHRVNLQRAQRLNLDGPVVRRLSRTLDGKRPLSEGLRRARIETLSDAQAVRELAEARVFEPVTGYALAPEEPQVRPYLEAPESAPPVERSGSVVYRRLRARGRVRNDEWADLEPKQTAAGVSRRRWYAAVAAVLCIIAGLFLWTLGRDHTPGVEVQVLDDNEEAN